MIGLVAFALAYAPVRIGAEIRRRREGGQENAATVTPLASASDRADDAPAAVDLAIANPADDVDRVA